MTRLFALCMSAWLAACSTVQQPMEPIITTTETPIALPVHCKTDVGPEPDYPDSDAALAAAPDVFSGVKLLLAGRKMRIARDGVKSAALAACGSGG